MNGKSILTMRVLAIGTLLTGLALMAGCGGGGGASVADGGIGGSGVIASGSVTATGSIFVNGVEYRVQDARFEREDEAPEFLNEIQDRVAVGMVVEVEGMLDATGSGGQALTIRYEDLVEGEIDGMTSSAPEIKVLEILAQQVLVEDGLTRFGPGLNFTTIESETGFIEVVITSYSIHYTKLYDITHVEQLSGRRYGNDPDECFAFRSICRLPIHIHRM